jgi:hypothetical protein
LILNSSADYDEDSKCRKKQELVGHYAFHPTGDGKTKMQNTDDTERERTQRKPLKKIAGFSGFLCVLRPSVSCF